MKCPYCEKKIGVDSNPFQYQSVSFIKEEGRKTKTAEVCALYCSKCGKVLGMVPGF